LQRRRDGRSVRHTAARDESTAVER